MILVTGATGFVGRRLCEVLAERGKEIAVLSRNAERARQSLPMVKSAFAWEPVQGPAPAEAFSGVEVVVNLAGETVGQKWNEDVKRRIRESRVIGTRNLVETMRKLESRPKVLVNASAIGYYGDRGDEELTEDSPPGKGFLAEVAKAWEEEAARAEELGVRVVRVRTGVVLEKDGGALKQLLPPFKMGAGGRIGSGRQWWSWIHRDDLIGLILHAIENELVRGPLNGTAPKPVTNNEFTQTLGAVLSRPTFLPTPVFGLKLMLGEFVKEVLLASQRVLPVKAKQTGYAFKYETLEAALRQILA